MGLFYSSILFFHDSLQESLQLISNDVQLFNCFNKLCLFMIKFATINYFYVSFWQKNHPSFLLMTISSLYFFFQQEQFIFVLFDQSKKCFFLNFAQTEIEDNKFQQLQILLTNQQQLFQTKQNKNFLLITNISKLKYNQMKLRMTKPKEKAKSKSLLSDQTKKKKVSPKNKKVSDKSKDKKQTKEPPKQTKSKKNQSKNQRLNKFFQDPYKTEIQNQEQSKKCSQTQKSVPYPPTPNVSRQALFGTMSKINNQILAKLSGLIINLRSLMIMTQAEIINAITYAKGMSPSISDYFEMEYTNRMSYIASLFKQNGRKYQKYQKMAQQQVNRVLNIYKQEWKENKFIYEIQTTLINDFAGLTLF